MITFLYDHAIRGAAEPGKLILDHRAKLYNSIPSFLAIFGSSRILIIIAVIECRNSTLFFGFFFLPKNKSSNPSSSTCRLKALKNSRALVVVILLNLSLNQRLHFACGRVKAQSLIASLIVSKSSFS